MVLLSPLHSPLCCGSSHPTPAPGHGSSHPGWEPGYRPVVTQRQALPPLLSLCPVLPGCDGLKGPWTRRVYCVLEEQPLREEGAGASGLLPSPRDQVWPPSGVFKAPRLLQAKASCPQPSVVWKGGWGMAWCPGCEWPSPSHGTGGPGLSADPSCAHRLGPGACVWEILEKPLGHFGWTLSLGVRPSSADEQTLVLLVTTWGTRLSPDVSRGHACAPGCVWGAQEPQVSVTL